MTQTADHHRAPLPLQSLGWALSGVLFVFMAWGRMEEGALFDATNFRAWLTAGGAGFLALAALGLLMQGAQAYGAQAIRRSAVFGLERSRQLAIATVAAGGAFTAWSLHNAIEQTGMIGPQTALGVALLVWLLSAAVPFVEFALWWMDEALRSAADTRKAADEAAALTDAQGRDRARQSPIGIDVASIEERALSDEALAAAVTMAFSLGKRLSDEQRRRAKSAPALHAVTKS